MRSSRQQPSKRRARNARARIMLLEDHPIFRSALRAMLEHGGHEIVAESDDNRMALRLVERSRPNVVMLDLSMPSLDSLVVARNLRQTSVSVKILLVSAGEEEADVIEALEASHADGYLTKHDLPRDLFDAIEALRRGRRYLSYSLRQTSVSRGGRCF